MVPDIPIRDRVITIMLLPTALGCIYRSLVKTFHVDDGHPILCGGLSDFGLGRPTGKGIY